MTKSILKRYDQNPIIKPEDFPYGSADAVFNCAQTMYGDKTILLLSVIMRNKPKALLYLAESKDGYNFKIREKPFMEGMEGELAEFDVYPIDARITRIDDTYYIVRPGAGGGKGGVCDFLFQTKDFESYEYMGIVALPDNRVPCLFPEKINGYYARIDRPFSSRAPRKDGASMWISYSPDLIHWGQHQFLSRGWIHWNSLKIGPTPPMKTEKGWLEIIHGVSTNCSTTRYSLGAMLLDLEDPSKIIGKMNSYILTPEADYEMQGNTPDVVFACGALADLDKRKLRIYYGGADTCICLAEGDLDEIIEGCIEGR